MSSFHKLCLCLVPALIIGCGESSNDTPSDQGAASNTAQSTGSNTAAVEETLSDQTPIPPVVPDEERGFETPAAAFSAFAKARTDKDFPGYVGALTADSQKALAGGTIFGLGMMAAFDESLKDPVTAIFKKHGLTEQNALGQPPPGITEDSTQIERMRAMGSVFDNPAAFIIEARNFTEQQPGSKNDSGVGGGELGIVTTGGDTASAPVKHRRGRKVIEFRRTAAGWLVHLTDDQFSTNSGITNSGSGKLDRFGMRDRNPEELAPVEPITVDEVKNAWKVSVDYQQRPAVTALQDITQKCGLTIYDQPAFADTLKQSVSVKLEDVSPLEVIEAICSQVNLHPRYKAGAMALNKGPRTLPIVFAGPFLIEATQTQELVPNAFGKLKFQIFAAGLPPAVPSRLANMYVQTAPDSTKLTFAVTDLKGGDGSALETRFRSFFPVRASTSSVQAGGEIDVAGLLRSVTNIAEFEGSISWSFPQKVEPVVLEKLKKDATTKVGDATISITSVNLNSRSSQVELNLTGLTHKDLLVIARDSSGAAIKNPYVSGYSRNDSHTASISAQGAIAKLDIRVILESDRVTFPFRFPSIPLAHYEDMPDALPELTFEGDVPVSMEFTGITEKNNSRTAMFRWTNHTNKDIYLIRVKTEFLDATGKVIQERPIAPSGNRYLLDFGESEETIHLGSGPPEGTVSARATLQSITFVDATEWNATEKP